MGAALIQLVNGHLAATEISLLFATTTMHPPSSLKTYLSCLYLGVLAGCALFPSWHWEKKDASEAEYSFDEAQCKAKIYSGTDGMVTNASVRRMHGCMEAKGWVKVPN